MKRYINIRVSNAKFNCIWTLRVVEILSNSQIYHGNMLFIKKLSL